VKAAKAKALSRRRLTWSVRSSMASTGHYHEIQTKRGAHCWDRLGLRITALMQ
jgi:hypothetical protein